MEAMTEQQVERRVRRAYDSYTQVERVTWGIKTTVGRILFGHLHATGGEYPIDLWQIRHTIHHRKKGVFMMDILLPGNKNHWTPVVVESAINIAIERFRINVNNAKPSKPFAEQWE